MKIRRLEIQGFKSFADRTVLKFGEGITGIVGPNGCGKSNIVDAIRWVMGEQSAKHLRGSGMQDVIFAGSESRGPMGMGEVTLTFKNDGNLVPLEYQRSDEISVTRRLFRDGTSEYAINKVPCRLKDILELFMGTGIGKNAYSIIEQGRIGLIVTAKPEDRRAIIEDAAGVSRYKARRKAAERRIEATEQNLLRVVDITSELEQRLESLEKQAKKAEKYKAIKSELKSLELQASAHRYLELEALERFESRRARELEAKLEADEAALAGTETKVLEALAALDQREAAVREMETEVHKVNERLALSRNNTGFLQREREQLDARLQEAQAEAATLSEEQVRLVDERQEAEFARQEVGADADLTALEAKEQALAQLESEIRSAEADLEAARQASVGALTSIAEHKNNLANLDKAELELQLRVDRAQTSKKAILGRLREFESKKKEIEAVLGEHRQLRFSLEQQRLGQEQDLARQKADVLELETQLQQVKHELMDKRSRLVTLSRIQRNYEGFSDAVRQLMQAKEDSPSLAQGLHGLVADVLSADARMELAVEAVLGDRLQHIIVNHQDDAIAGISYLREHQAGRTTFIPLDLREDHVSWAPRRVTARPSKIEADTQRPQPLESRPPHASDSVLPVPDQVDSLIWAEEAYDWPDLETPGVVGKLSELVRAQPGYEHVARVLLGDVLVVDDLPTAQNVWRSNGHKKTIVTLSGEVLDPVGMLSGGSSGKGSGMLSQKREIKDLGDAVRVLEAKVAIAEERHQSAKNRLLELERTLAEVGKQGHQGELSLASLERDVARLEEEIQRESQERALLDDELALLQQKKDTLRAEAAASESVVKSLEGQRIDSDGDLTARAEAIQARRQTLRSGAAELTELKVALAARREKRDGARRNFDRIVQRLRDVEARLTKLADIHEHGTRELDRLAHSILEGEAEAEQLTLALEAARQEASRRRAELDTESQSLKAEDLEAREQRKRLNTAKADQNQAWLKVKEYSLARQTLVEQVDERYRISLLETLTDHHLSAPLNDEHKKTLEKLRRQLDGIGAINLTAIEEFEQVNERYQFMIAQKKDLEGAISALKNAIRRINRTSKDRYLEAFRLVNEKFQAVFPKLFNGGRCALVMTDESDPLESGIEILAQPPGKKLQSVTLLSGGEKALTAVALIFGIFLIKPTPFCLLDEVDAPLDEANVGRYNEMVREMSSISQFILITHNKRTMELPDRLYGVTMEDPGISKIVPVDVKGADAKAS